MLMDRKTIEKRLRRLRRYAPHKKRELYILSSLLITAQNESRKGLTFNGDVHKAVHHFRKKTAHGSYYAPSPVGAEKRALGRIGVLRDIHGLRSDELKRDTLPLTPKIHTHQLVDTPKGNGAVRKKTTFKEWSDTLRTYRRTQA